MRNLLRLSSLSFLEGFYYKPRIDKEILERHAQGLICLSGCVSAEFSDYILHGRMAEAEKLQANGTPTFFIGLTDASGNQIKGTRLVGALPYASFKEAIDRMLANPPAQK